MSKAPPDGGFFPFVNDELRRLAAARLAGEWLRQPAAAGVGDGGLPPGVVGRLARH